MNRLLLGILLLLVCTLSAVAQIPGPPSKIVGTTTWTKTTVAQTGSSITLLAANNARTGFMVYNPTGNATAYVEPSGGTAVSNQAIPVLAGTFISFVGSITPKSAITTIGTNAQSVYVWEGT